jgi:hypothetical protein
VLSAREAEATCGNLLLRPKKGFEDDGQFEAREMPQSELQGKCLLFFLLPDG